MQFLIKIDIIGNVAAHDGSFLNFMTCMIEAAQMISIDETAGFHVICHDCQRVLYAPESDNSITRRVAQLTAVGHSCAFSEPHRVSVFKSAPGVEIYRTDPPRSFIQEGFPV